MTDSLAHMANLALHCIYSFNYPVQSFSYLTLRISNSLSQWSNLVLKGFNMPDALKQFLDCNVMWTKKKHKFNCNSLVIFYSYISCTTIRSQLLPCSVLCVMINYFCVKSKQWKSTTQRSLYSTILSHIWCTLHALWDYYWDPYNTINAVEKQKPLAPSRNWISLMSSLAHWW